MLNEPAGRSWVTQLNEWICQSCITQLNELISWCVESNSQLMVIILNALKVMIVSDTS